MPEGFEFAGRKRNDVGVGLIVSEDRANVAGTFTENSLRAAPVEYCAEICDKGKARAVIVNSGHANAMTGEEGHRDVLRTAKGVADIVGCPDDEVLVCSTGVIGVRPPVDTILEEARDLASGLGRDPRDVEAFNEAIMTTDTRPKIEWYEGDGWSLLGVAKGAGMIHPNMATMLAFIVTDLDIPHRDLREPLRRAVDVSFNMISVDGDESTNDTVLLMANGASGLKPGRDVPLREFEKALEHVCVELAKDIAADGEGATKFVEVVVRGAFDEEEARRAARAVVSSNLVKTALFGEDPNWGRVGAAVGAARVEVDPGEMMIAFESEKGRVVTYDGGPVGFDEEEAARVLSADEVRVIVDLGVGEAEAKAWGCDLSYDYVKINAEYRT
ncbi:MAG: bifunctional glutamate N-acetyltransferase/amino-acid acetyltransferase ArgJ [Methanopyri archaeon]|nr:bifunctional glutamate N-acetyltransferase/amino-acid acetyltransferase ArgJ [Methanopyri archaeon]